MLANNQNAAQNEQSAGLQNSSNAYSNALNALAQGSGLMSQLRSQNFGELSAAAQAKDINARFNAQNMQSIAGQNTNRANSAQQYNLQNAQQIANMNTGVANQQELQNVGAVQQNYENNLRKAQGTAVADQQRANQYLGNAQQTANMYSGIGQGVGQGMGAYAQYGQNQKMIDAMGQYAKNNYGTQQQPTYTNVNKPSNLGYNNSANNEGFDTNINGSSNGEMMS